jgi:hypothetical protein
MQQVVLTFLPPSFSEHLQLYSATGEGWKERSAVKQELFETKKRQSREAAELLDEFSAWEASVAEAVPASPPLATQLDAQFGEESSSSPNRKVPANVHVAAADSNDAPSSASSIASAPAGRTPTSAAATTRKRRQAPAAAQSLSSRGRGRGRGRPRLYPTISDLKNDPGAVVGRRIARYFDDPGTPGQVNLFFGSVVDFRMPEGDGIEDVVVSASGLILWDVRYDDGDEESLDAAELVEVLKLYQKNSSKDDDAAPDADAASATSERDDDDDDDDENAGTADAEAAAAAAVAAAAHGGRATAAAPPLELHVDRREEI